MKKNMVKKVMAGVLTGVMALSSGGSAVYAEESGEKEKITVAIYDRGNLNPEEGSMESNRWTEWINENAPVEVEFVAIPRWTSTDKYSTLFASDSAPDLILEYSTSYLGSLISNDCLMPIGDLIDKYSTNYKALLEQYPVMRKMGTVNGELYYLTQCNPVTTNHTLVMRKDWLDALELEIPQTVDDFYDVLHAFTYEDPDGNGSDDTYGYSLSFVSGQTIYRMFGNDGYIAWGINENGELDYLWDRYAAATEFEKKLYDAGVVSKDFAADSSGEQSAQDFISGKQGCIALNNGVVSTTSDDFYANNPDGELVTIALPSSEYGSFTACLTTGCQVVGGINAKCKNPEAVIQYIDWMNSSVDIYDMLKYGGTEYAEKQEDGSWVAKDPEVSAKEVYGIDYLMPISNINYGYTQLASLDVASKYYDKKAELYWEAYDAYIAPRAAIAQILTSQLPVLDSMMSLINSGTYGSSALSANWEKAIISGEAYSVEDALRENQQIVADGGGDTLLSYNKEWYKENKDNLVVEADIYALDNVER